MDLVFIEDQIYFIEPNCFGKDYSVGSALFHWVTDSIILCVSEIVDFRFTD